MSFLSGLIHAVTHPFGIGDDDQKKKQQQQQALQKAQTQRAPAQNSNNGGGNAPAIAQPSSQFSASTPLLKVAAPPQQPKIVGPAPVSTPNALIKVAQPNSTPAPAPAPAPPHASILHDITHNPVTNAVGDVAKPVGSAAAGTALGTLRAGEGLVSSTLELPDLAAHLGDFIGKKVTGDPNAKDPLTAAIDKATNVITTPIDSLQKLTDEGAAAYGKQSEDIYKPAQVATNVATLIPGAEAVLSKVPGVADKLGPVGDFIESQRGTPTLRKIVPGSAPSMPAVDPTPDELTPGVSSTNPNVVSDAQKQTGVAPPPEAPAAPQPSTTPLVNEPPTDNTPAFVRQPAQQAAAAQAKSAVEAATPEAQPQELDKPAFEHKQAVQSVIQDGNDELNRFVNEHPDAAPHEIETAKSAITSQVAANVQKLQDARAGVPDAEVPGQTVTPDQAPAPQAAPANVPATPPAPVDAPVTPAATPEPVTTPVQDTPSVTPASAPENGPATPVTEPQSVEHIPGRPTSPNAPNVRAAFEKNLAAKGAEIDATPTTSDILSNPDLDEAANHVVSNLSDQELLDRYKTGASFHGAADLAQGKAALGRLGDLSAAGNGDASKAVDNILEGTEKETASSGRTLNYARTFYEGLPKQAKVSYLIRNMDKLREAANLPLYRDDNSLRDVVEAQINGFLTKDEAIKQTMADADTRLNAIKDAAKNGEGSRALTKEASKLDKTIKQAKLAEGANTADLGRFYDSQVPRNVSRQTKAGDLGRTLMLSSVAGRSNDVITTAINSSHQLLQQSGEAMLGKVANVVTRTPGKAIDTLPSPKALVRGVSYGLKKSGQRFRGNVAAGDAQSLLKVDSGSGKAGLLRSLGHGPIAGLHKVVRAGTEVATDLSEGMKEAQVQRLATQEGKQLGLKGADLDTYGRAAAASPTREFEESGKQLQTEVNNMQDNPITTALSSVSGGIAKIPVVGEQLKNLTLPFTRWTGGQLWNAAVDKNVFVNFGRVVNAARKGDLQGALRNTAALGLNATTALTLGYGLAKAGVLTTKNAQGYNDDGVYLHVDGRYIPATFLGFYAPGIILGASTHDAMKDNGGGKGNILSTAVDATGKVLTNAYHAYGVSSLAGVDNPVISALQNEKENGGLGTAGITAAAQVAGQYIPAATNDVNAVANNGLKIAGKTLVPDSLDPTHQAALTKVTMPSPKTGKPIKNVPASIGHQLLNKIPGLSQKLPRNPGVAAPDLIDRTTRGDRDTGQEIQAAKTAQVAANVSATDKKTGVPDPNADYKSGDSFNNAVENRVENKHYDQAIAGLQQQLSIKEKAPDSNSKTTQPIKDQIAQIQVLKSGNFDPAVRDLYKSTSVSEWRDMGDPTSDTYDPATYQTLYNYDKGLAGKGVSGSSLKKSDPKYTVKTTGTGSGSSSANKAARAALEKVTSNTLGDLPTLGNVSFGNLAPQKITDSAAQVPTIQQIQPNQLIKKRTISVTTPAG